MHIELINSLEKFQMLQTEWHKLLDDAVDASVFSTWEWQYNWWRYYGKGHLLQVLVVKEKNSIIGIMPLYIHAVTLFKNIRVRMVSFIGVGGDTSPDYLNPIIEDQRKSDIALILSDYLLNELKGWDVICLTDMPSESIFRHVLVEKCQKKRMAVTQGTSARISYISLPHSWDSYLNGLHRDRRNTIKRFRRKCEKNYKVQFSVHDDEENINYIVNQLILLHRRRWHGKASKYAFSSPEYVGFHRDVINACARRGWIRFYYLAIDSKIVAVIYCYRFRDQIFYFQSGFDPEYSTIKPGFILIGYSIEHSILEGNTVFDFLRGEHDYKMQWATETKTTHRITVYRINIGAIAFRLRYEIIPKIKDNIVSFQRRVGLFSKWNRKNDHA